MKVTYEFLQHGWVKVRDKVKIYGEEGVVDYIDELQITEGGLLVDSRYSINIRQGEKVYREELERGLPSIIDIEIVEPELIQARIAEFVAAKLEEANKNLQGLIEQIKALGNALG